MDYSLQAAGIYIGLNLLINLALAYRVSSGRVRTNVMTGTGDDDALYRASRAHTVNTEYCAVGLIGLIALHLLSASLIVIHIAGLGLTLGRVLHAIGLARTADSSPPRMIGTLLTWVGQIVGAGGCLYYAVI